MDISPELRSRLAGLAERHQIDLILAFGSSVKGLMHAASDLDIAVRFRHGPPDWRAFGALQADLQELFPDQEVDLAVINTADPLFLKQIAETPELWYGHPTDLVELKILAFKRYVDHRAFLRLEDAYVRREIARRVKPA